MYFITYAEKVPKKGLYRDDGRVYSRVHYKRKKKIKVVFDCAASFQNISLN